MTDPGQRNSFYRKVPYSGRRMTPTRERLYRLALPVGLAIIRTWWRLCRAHPSAAARWLPPQKGSIRMIFKRGLKRSNPPVVGQFAPGDARILQGVALFRR